MTAREAPHLIQPLDRNQGGEGLALTLDDELVVSQGDAIEHVADALSYFNCRDPVSSIATT